MNEQNNTEMTWWERNKKKVLIIGGGVVAVGIGVVVFKNKDALIGLVKKGKTVVNTVSKLDVQPVIDKIPEVTTVVNPETVISSTPLNNGLPFGVRGGIRNLPNNRYPSAEKLAQAAALGIELGEHQTIVDPYMKNIIHVAA